MKFTFVKLLGILCLFTSLIGCEDYQNPAIEQRFRLKKTIHSTSYWQSYKYDGNNRLVSIEQYSKASEADSKTSLYYDGLGKLAKVETIINYDSASRAYAGYNSLPVKYTFNYVYDGNGNIAQVKQYSTTVAGYTSLDYEYSLAYGSAKFPIKVITKMNIGYQFDPFGHYIDEYTYNEENVIEVKHTELPTHVNKYTTTTYTSRLRYDNKVNPYYNLITGAPDISMFSKNNRLYNDEILTYNENDLLTKISTIKGLVLGEFEYEAY